ncbi:MAG: hypothetical protein DLM55_10840 [Acidimicrobiales bacterium]|nr:MAG: hypothetical protein DLM55_10840 [Acidimicrobiales bacterium]
MKLKTFYLTCVVLIVFFLVPPELVQANQGSTDAQIAGKEGARDSVVTEAQLKKPGSNSPDIGPFVPVVPPKKVSIVPSCDIGNQAFNNAKPGASCANVQCGNGKDQYIKITTDTKDNSTETAILCGLPDNNIEAQVIKEFYTNTVTVSAPAVSPSAATFANFPNIFWSDVKAYEQPTGITVAKVAIKFIPVKYLWDFGDAETMTTTEPGKPYNPALIDRLEDIEKNYTIIHRYHKTGVFGIKLTVTFNGEYSVNDGSWQPIAGSLQSTSVTHDLTVKQARGQFITTE